MEIIIPIILFLFLVYAFWYMMWVVNWKGHYDYENKKIFNEDAKYNPNAPTFVEIEVVVSKE